MTDTLPFLVVTKKFCINQYFQVVCTIRCCNRLWTNKQTIQMNQIKVKSYWFYCCCCSNTENGQQLLFLVSILIFVTVFPICRVQLFTSENMWLLLDGFLFKIWGIFPTRGEKYYFMWGCFGRGENESTPDQIELNIGKLPSAWVHPWVHHPCDLSNTAHEVYYSYQDSLPLISQGITTAVCRPYSYFYLTDNSRICWSC